MPRAVARALNRFVERLANLHRRAGETIAVRGLEVAGQVFLHHVARGIVGRSAVARATSPCWLLTEAFSKS